MTLISEETSTKVRELTGAGWNFMLLHDPQGFKDADKGEYVGKLWEADFTRRLGKKGGWDNHLSGYGDTPDEAINNAYDNIKNGRRLI